jgi:hypothetical protein
MRPGLAGLILALALAAPAAAAETVTTIAGAPGPGPSKYDKAYVTKFGPKSANRVLVLIRELGLRRPSGLLALAPGAQHHAAHVLQRQRQAPLLGEAELRLVDGLEVRLDRRAGDSRRPLAGRLADRRLTRTSTASC